MCFCVAVGLLWALLGSSPASAEDRVAELTVKLRDGADFRVRTQAALALGSTGSREAVIPLCQGLDDTSTAVRSAAAAALAKLNQGGERCLKRRLGEEKNAAVKSVISRALRRLEAPEPSQEARYYVAIGQTTNQTTREDGELSGRVRDLMIATMRDSGGFAWAPAGETAKDAATVLERHKQMKAVFLWPKVKSRFADGTLTVEFSVSVFTYPDKALVGTLSRRLSMMGVDQLNRSDEDELISTAVERIIPAVAQTAAQM